MIIHRSFIELRDYIFFLKHHPLPPKKVISENCPFNDNNEKLKSISSISRYSSTVVFLGLIMPTIHSFVGLFSRLEDKCIFFPILTQVEHQLEFM